MRLLTLAAAMLAVLLLTIALANAQEPPESQTATRLEPGINWVGESTSVSQLFREIPQLEAIWAWDAELDDWIVAGRDAPEGLGWLWRVSPGMGLRLAMGGEEPFLWKRPTEPTRGLVELRTGWNLVAWSGADGAPIEQVAKGIGWSLRELRRWNAANQQWTTWTSPERSTQLIATSATDQATTDEEAEPVTVRRGEALWVNTARAVNWIQPTDILPRLVFPGGASDALQARVRKDLESVLAFYGQRYGIQADPDFTIYVAKDVDALIQAYKDDGYEIDAAEAAGVRARWDSSGGWLGKGIVVKQTSWPEDLSTNDISWARYTLTHEYFHILQGQLSHHGASQWLSEGTASWAESDHQAIDGSSMWEDARETRVSAITEDTPTLRSTELSNAAWEYTLGWLAFDRLTRETNADFYIEFWRWLAPTESGPHGRWASELDWRAAFQETFGIPVSSFYADFDAWQREQAAANGAGASPDDDTRWIRGRVIGEDGASGRGVLVNAIRVEGETSVGWNQRAETSVDGAFAVRAPEDGDYRISIDIADDCTRYYSNSGITEELDEAQPITVAGSDVQDVSMPLPANICGWRIRGQVVNTAGEPLAGVSITICETTTHTCTWDKRTKLDGAFAISAPTAGEYRLRLGLADDCLIYYRVGSLTTRQAEASRINVTESDSLSLQLHVPTSMCAYQITGSVTKADGQPLTDTHISACREVDGRCEERAGSRTNDDGAFAVTVPADGRYQVSFLLENCGISFRAGGLTTSYSERSTVRVASRDARLSPRQIPEGMCARRIAGRFVDANGAPLVDKWIYANGSTGSGSWVQTDANGRFEIRVSSDDAYHFSFELRRQPYCWRNLEGQALGSSDNPVRVSGADVTGIVLRLPGTVEELCSDED